MCGRYTLTTPLEGLRQVFDFVEQTNLAPRHNIAPTQEVAAVRLDSDGARHLVTLRWGLLPRWAKDRAMAARMINARAETLATKPAFREAYRQRRCLILADGFYEWKTEAGRKQPYLIGLQDRAPFAFAGIWERWRDPATGDGLETCSIVTTEANDLLAAIHHRMPVILPAEAQETWLAVDPPVAALQTLLVPYDPAAMTFHRVSPEVGKVANDDPSLLQPWEPPDEAVAPEGPGEPRQGSLF